MSKAAAALRRAKTRYASGGALEKADLGDFRDSDPIRQAVRAVRDFYGSGEGYADPRGRNVSTALRRAGSPMSTPKQDREQPATDTLPAIWTGARSPVPQAPPTQEERDFQQLPPVDALRARMPGNLPRVPPGQAGANRLQNAKDALSIVPVVGNAIAGADAIRSGRDAVTALGEGKYKSAALNGGAALLSTVGAITGMPTGRAAGNAARGASSRTNVFVPAADNGALEMQKAGKSAEDIWRETKRVIAPSGGIRREIADFPMKIKPNSGRTFSNLDEAIEHPELFDEFPHLRDQLVRWVDDVDRNGRTVSRTNPVTGIFEVNKESPEQMRAAIAKLVQYRIAQDNNMPRAIRHGDPTAELDAAAKTALDAGSPHAAAYVQKVLDTKDFYRTTKAGSDAKFAERMVGNRIAANVDAKHVRGRASMEDVSGYPYARGPSYISRSRTQRPGAFEDLLPLPAEGASPAQVARMLEGWALYGSGRPKFATGGKVKGALSRARQRLAIGGLTGDTGGRTDAVPVKAAEGSYVIPADVVSALGEGNSMAGMKKLFGRFPGALGKGVKKPRLARGGAVDIIVSDGEFIVPPEDVAILGGGDVAYGHEVLDAFVLDTRQRNIQELAQLEGPKQ